MNLFSKMDPVQCVIFSLLLVASYGQFTPGCSFFNGQCVYNVKLGQENTCTAQASSLSSTSNNQPSGSCTCSDVLAVKTDVANLKAAVAQLKAAVNQLNNQLNLTNTDLAQVNNELHTASQTHDNLVAVMQNKETLLNMTKAELVDIMQNASTEITHLREQLLTENHQLSQCQTALNPSTTTHTAAVSSDYSEIYCPFQEGTLCGFTQDRQDDGDWTHTHDRQSTSTGPLADHTYGTPSGYYMLLDSKHIAGSSSFSSKKVRLISPTLHPANNYCIRFWYNMNGRDVQELNVYAKVGGGYGYPVWTGSGNQGAAWHLAQFSINREYTGRDFNIVFEATSIASKHYVYHSGSGSTLEYRQEQGDIAIDDVYFYNTTCDAIRKCPQGSHMVHFGNDSKCLVFETSPQSWNDASEVCRKHSPHSHLATIKSLSQQNEIVKIIKNDIVLKAAGSSGFYINANDQKTEANFYWTDTGTSVALNYTNWHAGQPNDVGSQQDCVLLEYPDDDYEWGDVDCNLKKPFICEIDV